MCGFLVDRVTLSVLICVSLYIFVSCLVFFILYCFVFLFLVVAPRLPMRTLRDLGVRGSHFCIVFHGFRVVCAFFIGICVTPDFLNLEWSIQDDNVINN